MRVNERSCPWSAGLTIETVRRAEKPEADIVILNGFPVEKSMWETTAIAESDDIVLIRRGEIPREEDLAALTAARHTPGVAAVLREACVGIAGAGGLGSHVAHALARIGVGRLVVADYDVVEPSNLNRQAYRVAQIGLRKTEALAEDLAAIQPFVRVETHPIRLTRENIPALFRPCHVAVECLDRPEEKAMFVETVRACLPDLPIVAASGIAGLGDGNEIRVRRLGSSVWVVGDDVSAATFGHGLMAPRVLIAAGQQANTVVRILLGKERATLSPPPVATHHGGARSPAS